MRRPTPTSTVTVVRMQPTDIGPVLAARLRRYTIPDGMMWPTLRRCQDPAEPYYVGDVYVAVDDTWGQVVGWALRFKDRRWSNDWHMHVFVTRSWRRHRVGATLVAAATRRVRKTVWAYPWDDASNSFWDSTAADSRAQIAVT